MSTAEVDLGGTNLLIRLVVLDMMVYLVSQLVFYVLPAPALTNMSVISWHFAASMATIAFRFKPLRLCSICHPGLSISLHFLKNVQLQVLEEERRRVGATWCVL